MKIYWKQHIIQPIYFHYRLCLCMNFTIFRIKTRGWGGENERGGFPEWFSIALAELDMAHYPEKSSLKNARQFFMFYCQMGNVLFSDSFRVERFAFCLPLISFQVSIKNASDTREKPSQWNRNKEKTDEQWKP